MTRLTAFLASIYDAFSEAEMQALKHGQARLAELLESGDVPEDVTVPVYHASDVQVNLDVGLVAEETERGMEVYVTEAGSEEASQLDFTVELFELLEKGDLEDIDYEPLLPGSGDDWPTGITPSDGVEGGTEDEQTRDVDEDTQRGDEERTDDEERTEEKRAEREERREEEEKRAEREEEKREEREERREEEEKHEEREERDAGDDEDETGRGRKPRDERTTVGSSPPPVGVIDDIDRRHEARLREAGVEDLSALVDRSPEELAETLAEEDADVSPERAAEWLSEARGLSSILAEREADLPVEMVDGIGPTFGTRLREAGIEGLADLIDLSPEAVAERASTGEATVSADRAAGWLDRAGSKLAAIEGERTDETTETEDESGE